MDEVEIISKEMQSASRASLMVTDDLTRLVFESGFLDGYRAGMRFAEQAHREAAAAL